MLQLVTCYLPDLVDKESGPTQASATRLQPRVIGLLDTGPFFLNATFEKDLPTKIILVCFGLLQAGESQWFHIGGIAVPPRHKIGADNVN